jgi:hypothetical protein
MIFFILVSLISVTIFILLANHAPHGYEDETGFHYRKKSDLLNSVLKGRVLARRKPTSSIARHDWPAFSDYA